LSQTESRGAAAVNQRNDDEVLVWKVGAAIHVPDES